MLSKSFGVARSSSTFGIGSWRRISTGVTKFSAKPWISFKNSKKPTQLNHQLFRRISSKATATSVAAENTHDYRVVFHENGKQISPWHDIPLVASVDTEHSEKYYNFICEIPANTRSKMEISTTEEFNPIKQDVNKSGTLRSYHGPIYWNYGCLPQTWEDPHHFHPECECYGDNDPVDVVEVGSTPLPTGSVTPIRILGGLGLKDQGELDWKLIGIRADDPLVMSNTIQDVESLESVYPHVINGIREWFRWYKVPDNKPLNEYAYDGNVIGREKALGVVDETHEQWKQLIRHKKEDSKALWTPPAVDFSNVH